MLRIESRWLARLGIHLDTMRRGGDIFDVLWGAFTRNRLLTIARFYLRSTVTTGLTSHSGCGKQTGFRILSSRVIAHPIKTPVANLNFIADPLSSCIAILQVLRRWLFQGLAQLSSFCRALFADRPARCCEPSELDSPRYSLRIEKAILT